MAGYGNKLYKKGVQHLMNGDIDLDTDTIKCALVTSAYAQVGGDVNLNTDEFFATAVSTDYIGTPVALTSTNISATPGTFDAGNVTFSSVSSGTATAMVIYVAGSTPGSDDYLLAYWDDSGTFSVTANGGDITVTWNASGIFTITAGS
tara:strand:+ start:338 stop:781 length:444 start_codon:yes stop_codon:yes gene_type:complete